METGKNKSGAVLTFTKKDAQYCHLALCIYTDAVRVGISHLPSKQHIYRNEFKIKSWRQDLEPFLKFEFENARFKSATAALMNHSNLIVPEAIFSEETVDDLYDFSVTRKRGAKLTHEKVKFLGAHNVFQQVSGLEKSLVSYIKNYRIIHYHSVLLEMITREAKNSEEDRVYLHLNKASFDLFVFRHEQLLLANTFKMESKEDLAYHFLNAAEKLQVNLKKSPVYLMGEIFEDDLYTAQLEDYCTELIFNECTSIYSFSPHIDAISHQDYALFSQVLCA